MRFDTTENVPTAQRILEKWDERELMRIFREYGEDPKGFFVAKFIVEARKTGPIDTSGKLLEIIQKASFDPKSKVRIFQALRIAVNQEFEAIENAIKAIAPRIAPEGRFGMITFHSLEDRIVKLAFGKLCEDERDEFTGQSSKKAEFRKTTKKPVVPTTEEIETNPRSRSAKWRVIERIA